jgi:hypothetical protein
MSRSLRLDLTVVILLVVLAVPISLFFKTNFLTSTILFFAVPSIYLLVKQKRQLGRIFAASGIFGIIFGFAFDFLAEVNNAWSWAGTDQLVFPYKILGVVNIDVMIWFFFWVFFAVIFYEHFFERDRAKKISSHFKYALFPMSVVVILLTIVHTFKQELLLIPYAYLILGIFTLFPFAFLMIKRPHILPKLLKASIFFIALYLVYEITALSLDQWRFTGEYVGVIKMGKILLPLEELFIWIISSSTILLSYYELYIDDMK